MPTTTNKNKKKTINLQCMECENHFSIDDDDFMQDGGAHDVECPECGSTDIDLDDVF